MISTTTHSLSDSNPSVDRYLEMVANTATRREKVSWERKQNNMEKLVASLEPIEQQIQDLMTKKDPILEEMYELRKVMVQECIHPKELLVLKMDKLEAQTSVPVAECKFCLKRIRLLDSDIEPSTLA